MIRNTEKDAKDPANALLFVAASMGPGGSSQAIAEQESAGQAQLVNSECLPTDLNSDEQATFEALGIVFDGPVQGDPLFQYAYLPEGWTKRPADHDMWSYVLDELGRRRVSVFYKAAFYDRRAHMNVVSVSGYVDHCVQSSSDIITDDTWATPAAVLEAAREGAKRYARREEQSREYRDASEETAKREAYEALVARFETAAQA
ncbi:hypothetical protein AB0D27_11225 [Streptomyces sp. NPDC048415]|uniref:hypothetical protein n=1 Tax=Streptomyces sp. NPDC048415 TaxID=3154822 RepID=UPI003449DDEC